MVDVDQTDVNLSAKELSVDLTAVSVVVANVGLDKYAFLEAAARAIAMAAVVDQTAAAETAILRTAVSEAIV